MEGDFESRAWKFLHELYSLAHGDPKSVVVGREAPKRASIPYAGFHQSTFSETRRLARKFCLGALLTRQVRKVPPTPARTPV
jgi:hypothetical protein